MPPPPLPPAVSLGLAIMQGHHRPTHIQMRSTMIRRQNVSSAENDEGYLDALTQAWVRFRDSGSEWSLKVFESDEIRRNRSSVVSEVKNALADCDPKPVGSYQQGLTIPGSDIDICCNFDDVKAFAPILQQKLRAATDIRVLANSTVPVVKFRYRNISFDATGNAYYQHHCDIAQWVSNQLQLYPGLRDAILYVKGWAQRQYLSSSGRGSLSSLAFIIMLVSLVENNLPIYEEGESDSSRQTAQLLYLFFTLLEDMDFSIRLFYSKSGPQGLAAQGQELNMIQDLIARYCNPNTGYGSRLFILDPYEYVNVGRTVDDIGIIRLRRSFKVAAEIIRENKVDPFNQILSKFVT